MTSIALVLGAGGIVGGAYEIGALAGLAAGTGWDARRADLLVGTSAGSGVGALVRAGLAPADHFARAVGEPLSSEGAALVGDLGALRPPADEHKLALDGLPWPAAPWLLPLSLLPPWPARTGVALAGLSPRGSRRTDVIGDRVRAVSHGPWPEPATWICAMRLRDGRRVVFGRDDVETPDLGTACEASSAVPGVFRPVRIGGTDYVDGGAVSPTNADLVAGLGFDLVVIVSPMSVAPGGPWWSPTRLARMLPSLALGRETALVTERGTPVLVLEPTPDDVAVMGRDPFAHERVPAIARAARASVRARLEHRSSVRWAEVLREAC